MNRFYYLRMPLLTLITIFISLTYAEDVDISKAARLQWHKGYQKMETAEQFRKEQNWTKSLEYYLEAKRIFSEVRRKYPFWNSTLLDYRMGYCQKQINRIEKRLALKNEDLSKVELLAKLSNAKMALKTSQHRNKSLNNDIDALTDQLLQLRRQSIDAQGEILKTNAELVKENSQYRRKISNLETQVQQLLKFLNVKSPKDIEAELVEKILAEKKQETEKLKRALKAILDKEATLKELYKTNKQLSISFFAEQEKVKTYEHLLNQEKSNILYYKKTINAEIQSSKNLKQLLNKAQEKAQKRKKTIADLNNIIEHNRPLIAQGLKAKDYPEQIIKLRDKIGLLENELKQHLEERDKLKSLLQKTTGINPQSVSKNGKVKHDYMILQERIQFLLTHIDELDEALKQEKKDSIYYRKQVKRQEKEYGELLKEKKVSKQQIKIIRQERDILIQRNHSLRQDLQSLQDKLKGHTTQARDHFQLKLDIKNLQLKLKDFQDRYQTQIKINRELSNKLEELRKQGAFDSKSSTSTTTNHKPRIEMLKKQISTLNKKYQLDQIQWKRDLSQLTHQLGKEKQKNQQLTHKLAQLKPKDVIRPPTNPEKHKQIQQHLQQASEAEEKKRNELAKGHYLAVLALDLQHSYALMRMGIISIAEREFSSAEKYLMKAFYVDPDNGDILLRLGFVLAHQGKTDMAISMLGRAAALFPENANIHRFYGVSLRLLGWYQAAEKEFLLSYKLDPKNTETPLNLAILYATLKTPDIEAAKKWYTISKKLGAESDPKFEAFLNQK